MTYQKESESRCRSALFALHTKYAHEAPASTDGVLLLFQNFSAQKSVTSSRFKVRSVNGTTEVRREHIVNQGIGCAVQRCQTLDEVRDGDRVLTQRNVPIDLQQTPQKVRCPAKHEDCNNKE